MSGGIDKYQFQYDPRFEALRNQGVSFEDFKAHEEYYVKKLGSTSILDLFKDGTLKADKFQNLYAQTNVFTQAKHDLAIQNVHKKHTEIAKSIEEWQAKADAKKAQAEEEYAIAREAEALADAAKAKAYSEFQNLKLQYQKNQQSGILQSKFENAKFKLANATLNADNAEFDRKLSGEHLVYTSQNALRTFVTTSMVQKIDFNG